MRIQQAILHNDGVQKDQGLKIGKERRFHLQTTKQPGVSPWGESSKKKRLPQRKREQIGEHKKSNGRMGSRKQVINSQFYHYITERWKSQKILGRFSTTRGKKGV